MQKRFTFLFVFLVTFILFFHPISDFSQDLGRHLKLGEIILQIHAVPKTNLFSYTYPDFFFINTHWLSEVVFYLVNKTLGIRGLLIIVALAASISITIIANIAYSITKKMFLVLLATLLYLSILLERTGLRPEIFSFLFLSLFITILYRNREKVTRWIFLLPVLELLWVNMHIYFILGPALIGIFLIEDVTSWLNKKNRYSLQRIQAILFVFVLVCIATLVNPYGIAGAISPFTLLQRYGYSIQENLSLFSLWQYGFWYPWFNTIIIATIILVLLLLINLKKLLISDILLFLLSLIAFLEVRNFPVFVFVTFILFVRLLEPLVSFFEKQFKPSALLIGRVIILILGVILLLNIAYSAYGFGFGIKPSAEKGVDFFIQSHLQGPVFNNFDIGSYLDYRLYPKERVFVDGRPEAYPVDFFQKAYIPMQENEKEFAKQDGQYHFQTIFWAHTDTTPWANTFLEKILMSPNWDMVYLDETIIIFIKNNSPHQNLSPLSQKDFLSGKVALPNDYNRLMQITRIIDLLGWKDAEIQLLQKIVTLYPRECFAWQLLLKLLIEKNDPAIAIYYQTFQTYCK